MIGAEKIVMLATSKVKELTASLNNMIGLPEETKLDLVPPEPLTEDTSMDEAVDKAVAANVQVVEAEQTAVKAKAGSALSKMQYFPSVAIVGGYTNQNALKIILPRDFSYIGVIATYTVFDFGKRERGVKESDAQAEMAELAVPLTKAKVSAEVKSSYFELERSRKLHEWRAGWFPRVRWFTQAPGRITRKLSQPRQKWKQTCFGQSSNIARHTPG